MKALELLRDEYKVSIYDARFAKPVDIDLLRNLIEHRVPIVTVEDHGLEGGFGSCVLDACHDAGLDTRGITRLGLPCRWIYQGSRSDQLEEAGLDPASIARSVREALDPSHRPQPVVAVAPRGRDIGAAAAASAGAAAPNRTAVISPPKLPRNDEIVDNDRSLPKQSRELVCSTRSRSSYCSVG